MVKLIKVVLALIEPNPEPKQVSMSVELLSISSSLQILRRIKINQIARTAPKQPQTQPIPTTQIKIECLVFLEALDEGTWRENKHSAVFLSVGPNGLIKAAAYRNGYPLQSDKLPILWPLR